MQGNHTASVDDLLEFDALRFTASGTECRGRDFGNPAVAHCSFLGNVYSAIDLKPDFFTVFAVGGRYSPRVDRY